MTLVPNPYAAAGLTYLKRRIGSPIPLPYRAKKPPLDGWTGYDAPYASGADVVEWSSNGRGSGNIALRLDETVIGIDVDAYGEKHGDEELERLMAELGPLPATFTSTSREWPSGIRLFRVPPGRCWADIAGPGIEIIHHGHRYCVVAPSIHPDTGEAYYWIGPDGQRVAGPRLEDLPPLPLRWIRYLDRGPVSERSGKASVTSESVSEMLAAFPDGEPCSWLLRVLHDSAAELSTASSRHDTTRHWIAVVVRAGEQGHVGARRALDVLHDSFEAALAAGENRAPDHGEWERMVEGAVAIVTKAPTPEADRGCCGSPGTGVDLSFEPPEVASFWETRPILEHIRTYAQAQRVSAWAVLGVVLTRCVVRTRHEVVLPDLIGGPGSLNLFVALVGASGQGKGAAERAAKAAVNFRQQITTATIGSGEGICHLYAHREVKDKISTVVRHEHAVLFSVQEVDTLGALGARQGATLLPELRKAWTGEQLGMAYADPQKRLPIEEYSYRMGLILGVQPLRAADLLNDVGGTPHRFVWLPCTDMHPPEKKPAKPVPWVWEPPEGVPPMPDKDGLMQMDVPQVVRDAVDEFRWLALQKKVEPLDGHKLQCQLKVAAALALLDSRWEVTESDWSLSETIMRMSSRTRDAVGAELARAATESRDARAKARGHEAVVVAETVELAVVGRCRERVLKLLGAGEWVAQRELRIGVSKEQREHLDMMLSEMVAAGQVERKNEVDRDHFRLVKP